jgi:2-haloacid dehalogenase
MRFESFSHLSFDCYGTLIDWETGILEALGPVLARHGVAVDEAEQLRLYAENEAREEAGPYRRYREVLRGVMAGMGRALGFEPSPAESHALADSVGSWPPFPDTVEALLRIGSRYRLVIISNIDDELFARTARLLEVPFDEVVTAQQAGSYKPSPANFRLALERQGIPKEKLLHVAQSLYHDHLPAKGLGLSTVWVNRPSRRPGVGVAPDVEAVPDLEVPDLQSLAEAAGLWGDRA